MRYQTHKYNKSIINDVVQRKQQLIVAIMLIRLTNCLVIKRNDVILVNIGQK